MGIPGERRSSSLFEQEESSEETLHLRDGSLVCAAVQAVLKL